MSSATMQAIRAHHYGGPEVLQLDTLPMPDVGPREALVHVKATGVNFADTNMRMGDQNSPLYMSDLPFTPGREITGIVEQIGDGVTNLKVGDRVAWMARLGGYVSHVVAPAMMLIPLPDALSFEVGCAILLQGITAHALTKSAFPLREGQTALVQSAAGGLGMLITQMAKLAGARVIGVTSSDAKAEVARANGADEVIISTQQDIAAEARRLTAGVGVDVVYDGVGKDAFEANLDSLRKRGYMVMFGQSSGHVPPVKIITLMNKGSLYLTRLSTLDYMSDPVEARGRMTDVLTWAAQGKLRPHIGQTFPLAQAAEAHRALEARTTTGKILLIP